MVHDVMGVRMTRSAAYEVDVLEFFISFLDLLLFTLRRENQDKPCTRESVQGTFSFGSLCLLTVMGSNRQDTSDKSKIAHMVSAFMLLTRIASGIVLH